MTIEEQYNPNYFILKTYEPVISIIIDSKSIDFIITNNLNTIFQ